MAVAWIRFAWLRHSSKDEDRWPEVSRDGRIVHSVHIDCASVEYFKTEFCEITMAVNWVAYLGAIAAVLTLAQQAWITYRYRIDRESDWSAAANFYRAQMKGTVLVGILVWIVLAALLLSDFSNANHPFTSGYAHAFNVRATPIIILMAQFFTGCIRLFVEHIADETFLVRKRDAGTSSSSGFRAAGWRWHLIDIQLCKELWWSFRNSDRLVDTDDPIPLETNDSRKRHDAWLWWFVFSTIIAIVTSLPLASLSGERPDSDPPSAGAPESSPHLTEPKVPSAEGGVGPIVSDADPDDDAPTVDSSGDSPTEGVEGPSNDLAALGNAAGPTGSDSRTSRTERAAGGGDDLARDKPLPLGLGVLFAILANTVVVAGYFSWIYVGLFVKLTAGHGFNGKTARLLIGQYNDRVTPRQVLLIGPKGAGKTAMSRGNSQPPSEELDSGGGHLGTSRMVLRISTAYDANQRLALAKVSAIDTPGENVGDHILIASRYRTDTLVLVVDAATLDSSAVADGANYGFEFAHKLFRRNEGEPSQRYMQALWYATNRDGSSLHASEVFRVKTFLLYLNHRDSPSERSIISDIRRVDKMQQLAEEIGGRFGVDPNDCCVLAGQAPLPGQGRDLLGYQLREDRKNYSPGLI